MAGEKMHPSIIYNVAGAPLKSFFQGDMQRLGETVRTSGFEGISALPFRTEDLVNIYKRNFPPIVLVEDAWNPGTFNDIGRAVLEGMRGELRRKLGDTTEPPILQDTLFFPNKNTAESLVNTLMQDNPQAHYGSVSFDSRFPADRTYVHIQREYKPHRDFADEILQRAQNTNTLLLFDPTHLLDPQKISYPNQATRSPRGGWERQLLKFSSLVAGIDIHATNQDDLKDLQRATGTLYELAQAGIELCTQLQFLRMESVIPLTAQLPLSPYQASGIRYLHSIVEALKSVRQ